MGLLLHQACVSQCYHESFYPCHSFCQTKMSYYQTISSKDASGKWRRSQGRKPWEVTVTQNGCTEKELVNNLAFMITDSYVKVNTNNAIGKLSPDKFIITRFYRQDSCGFIQEFQICRPLHCVKYPEYGFSLTLISRIWTGISEVIALQFLIEKKKNVKLFCCIKTNSKA